MAYHLGVDLGTTYTCAAVARDDKVEIVTLGDRAAAVPSVLFLRDDGTFLIGEAAERRALSEPGRVAREFKRRMGDTAPVLVGGSPYGAEVLTARLLAWVVGLVVEREGGPPAAIAVTHPANWGRFKLDLLQQAVQHAGVGAVSFLSEPEAAARSWASQERVDVGSIVAVYDLGGGTFDAAVLSKTADGFVLLGAPQGIERLGGIDVDAAVLAHVDHAVDGAIGAADPSDPAVLAAVARLRREVVEAKEALSSDSDVTIAVSLPNLSHSVRLTRGELEGLIRPVLTETITALRRALEVAGVLPAALRSVLLVGGSSRIPLVAQLVGAELGRPVALDAHPKHAVALGAALAAATTASSGLPTEAVPVIVPPVVVPTAPIAVVPAPPPVAIPAPLPTTAPVAVVTQAPAAVWVAPPARSSHAGRWAAIVLLVVLVAGVAVALALTLGKDDDLATGPSTTSPAVVTTLAATTVPEVATTAAPPVTEPPAFGPSGRVIAGPTGADGALLPGDTVLGRSDGAPVQFALEGIGTPVRVGVEGFDGYDTQLQIIDGSGTVVAFVDDLTNDTGQAVNRDPAVTITIPSGQTFTAVVEPFADDAGTFVLYVDPV